MGIMSEITLQRRTNRAVFICPWCEKIPQQNMKLSDADTLTISEVIAPEGHIDTSVMWGECRDCTGEIFILDIGIPSESVDGFYYLNDHCHEVMQVIYYDARIDNE